MTTPVNILVLGASYGLLPGTKLALAGHCVTFVARADEIAAITQTGIAIHITPRRDGGEIVLAAPVAERAAPGEVALRVPDAVDLSGVQIVILAMQEPQYQDGAVAALMQRIAAARLPVLSIMNLAPPPFLARLGLTDRSAFQHVYSSGEVWDAFEPGKFTLASPDPQAVRPDAAIPGRLQVTLPSNFKAAPFALAEDQALLLQLAGDMSRLTVTVDGAQKRPPVALIASGSLFVSLAKWPMLLAGNCRCVLPSGARTIADAVLSDLEATSEIYQQVTQLTVALGAREQDLVPFESYTKAAAQLTRPSSLA
ncbi:MAG: hypothetical protein EOP61_41775, partial [Sphingomonadales bacterium]